VALPLFCGLLLALPEDFDGPLLAARVVCILLALLAGYIFAFTTPDWREDRYREGTPHAYGVSHDGGLLSHGDPSGMYGCGCLGGFLSQANEAVTHGRTGLWLPGLLLALAVGLGLYCWGSKEDVNPLYTRQIWFPLLAAAVGYVIGRLRDEGPVGPLR
jgi:hypothetical protein